MNEWKIDRFTSNQDKNDQPPILYMSSNTFHQQKCFVFVIICNYPGGLRVAEANWRCIYLLGLLLGQQSTVTMFAMKTTAQSNFMCVTAMIVSATVASTVAATFARRFTMPELSTDAVYILKHIISPEMLRSYRLQPDAVRRSSDSERIYPVCVG